MSTLLHFIFSPTLDLWSNEDDNREINFPTINHEFNNIVIRNLINDTTNIKNILYPLIPLSYKYDITTNLIHVWAHNKDGKNVTSCDLAEILYNYSPDVKGPDTWMSQDIDIVTREEAKKFGYYAIQMLPKLLKVFVESEVDLKALSCD